MQTMKTMIETKEAYFAQKHRAANRGIAWHFTFDSWCDLWIESGKWKQRGKGGNQYCMARLFDLGEYSADNVKIITNTANTKEALRDTGKQPSTRDTKIFYLYDCCEFDNQKEIAQALGKSVRTIQKMIKDGAIIKMERVPERKVYNTPVGSFYSSKEMNLAVRKEYRADLTRQAIWHRFNNDSYPEFYYSIEPAHDKLY